MSVAEWGSLATAYDWDVYEDISVSPWEHKFCGAAYRPLGSAETTKEAAVSGTHTGPGGAIIPKNVCKFVVAVVVALVDWSSSEMDVFHTVLEFP